MNDQAQQKNDSNNQPVTPVSSVNKEAGPIRVSEAEPVLHPDVVSAGVEVVSEPKLTEEHEKIGVQLSKESTPVSIEPSGKIKLPMTDEKVETALKEGPGKEMDVQKQFEGIYFAKARFFLATLVDKIKKRLRI